MNKKPYKDIELQMKAASEAYQPALDEEAWKKMELLLDKEKDRKKPFFWLWWLLPLVVVTGGVGGYIILKNNNSNDPQPKIATNAYNKPPVSGNNKNNTVQIGDSALGLKEKIDYSQLNNTTGEPKEKDGLKNHPSIFVKTNSHISSISNNEFPNDENELFQKRKVSGKLGNETAVKIQLSLAEGGDEKVNDSTGNVSINGSKEDILKMDPDQLKHPLDTNTENLVKENKPVRKPSNFYFIAALGIEANGVKLFSNSEYTARYGLAVGYQFNKNISIQTGFFAGNKKYVAGPDDYNAKDGSYWNMVDIIKVDANCVVYEIPVLIRYDFTPGKKINIFASTGLSSYIMKKEDYHYHYYRYGSTLPHYADASYKGNQNLFSVVRISAGVEKKLSNQFSLNLAPGLAIPLSGVGEGQVKLYSADVMIGIKFAPLKKK